MLDGLPAELAQGLFGVPGAYAVVVSHASEPGTLEPDTEQRARGFVLKVLGVPGEMLHIGWTGQDFLINAWSLSTALGPRRMAGGGTAREGTRWATLPPVGR